MSTTTLDRPMAPVRPTLPDLPALPELPALPDEPIVPVPRRRLSEAIREGCRYHRQGRTHLYNPATNTTCALGAALVGILGPEWTWDDPNRFDVESVNDTVWERMGVDLSKKVRPPEGLNYALFGRHTVGSLIIRLNDGARWSRERIADYLESLGL